MNNCYPHPEVVTCMCTSQGHNWHQCQVDYTGKKIIDISDKIFNTLLQFFYWLFKLILIINTGNTRTRNHKESMRFKTQKTFDDILLLMLVDVIENCGNIVNSEILSIKTTGKIISSIIVN